MTTAIVDVEMERLPPGLEGLGAAASALVLVRLRGCPVAQLRVPVEDGRVEAALLGQAVAASVTPAVWHQGLAERVGAGRPTGRAARPATVAVSTRDRTDDLRRCLDALMRLPDDGQELLVIDNCPATEATRDLVAQYPTVRYLREMVPGLNAVRNRACREARHDIVAYTDDDAAPDPNWLRALLANFEDPLVTCVTGLVMPLELETPAQEWSERFSPHGRGFVRRSFDMSNWSPLRSSQTGVGANFAIRRSVLDRVGPFDEALGPGTPTRTGDETELWSRLLTAGDRIVYDPAALVWHRHRRTWEELQKMVYGNGVGAYAAWTRNLVVEREWGVLRLALGWLVGDQLPRLVRSLLRRPGAVPLDLTMAELRGCAAGPWAFFESRRLHPMAPPPAREAAA